MKLIVGLGNPGKDKENTKHNIGFIILDNFLGDISWKKETYAYSYKTKINNEDVIFIKPTTFMNLSGDAVNYYMKYYKISENDILVIQDDLDMPFSKIKIKIDSSSGGHNGIKDIINKIGNNHFLRLKFGISKPNNNEIIDYVLSSFSKEEIKTISEMNNILIEIINDFISSMDTEQLMNKYNGYGNIK